jgi:hypothetical protein
MSRTLFAAVAGLIVGATVGVRVGLALIATYLLLSAGYQLVAGGGPRGPLTADRR